MEFSSNHPSSCNIDIENHSGIDENNPIDEAPKPATTDELMPLVQAELRRVARRYLAQERPGHTLQPTALINEAYMRLAGQREYQWQNHAQFIAVAAQLM